MGRRLAALLLTGLALAGGAPTGAVAMKRERPRHTTPLPRPRDPNIAVQEELDAARHAGTVAAYDRFLARHGDHPLAEVALRERGRLLVSTRR